MQDSNQKKKRGRYRSYLHEDISPSKVPRRTKRRLKEKANRSNDDYSRTSGEDKSLSPQLLDSDCEVGIEQNEEDVINEKNECGNDSQVVETLAPRCNDALHEFLNEEDWEKLGNTIFDTDVEDNEEKGEKEEEEESKLFEVEEIVTQDDYQLNEEEKSSSTDPPLYDGSALTVSMHVIAILTFAMAQSLTATAIAHLLVLIFLHCPTPNNCVRTMHRLWNQFKSFTCPIEWHYLCTRCNNYHGKEKPLASQHCSNCKGSFKDGKFKSWDTFIVFPIVSQLTAMLENSSFVEALTSYRFKHEENKRKKNTIDNIEDIIDGKNYQRFFKNDGFLSNPTNMSFQLNTDGVALFKSSNFSIWPVYLIICDLPPKLRYSRKYRLFAGLWFGFTKPVFSTFLTPFKNMFQQFYKEGVKTIQKDSGEEVTWRGIVISSSMDAPAKCIYMCMKQFNGECGCPYCKAKGINLRTESKGNCRIYPYIEVAKRGKESPLRDHDDFLIDAKKAVAEKKAGKPNPAVNGVRSISIAFGFPGYDIITGTAIDYMHTVLLGVMKQLLTYWFDKKHRKSPWYCGRSIKTCDSRRASIKPPSQVSRIPRSLEERGHYKASELRTWLLYYSLPVMQGILPESHYQHLMLFVCAIYLLLKESISPQDIKKSRLLLEHFCLRAKTMYGERFLTFNVHQLLHLSNCVQNNGPLWACSCFFFEDLNGDLRSLFHGSQNVEEQIIRSVATLQHIPKVLEEMIECPTRKFCNSMINKKEVGYITEIIDTESKMYVLGSLKSVPLNDPKEIEQLQIASGNTAIFDIEYEVFERLKIGKDIIHSKKYERVSKRDSTVVEFTKQGGACSYGTVKYFIAFRKQCSSAMCDAKCICKGKEYIGVIEEFKRKEGSAMESSNLKGPKATVTHLIPVERSERKLTYISVKQIIQSCFLIDTGAGCMYVGIPPNRIERE